MQKTTHAVRAIGRMSILRLATQQRKQNVSPTTPDSSSEKKETTDIMSGDDQKSSDKEEEPENRQQELTASHTHTSKHEEDKAEKKKKSLETSLTNTNERAHSAETSKRITNEGDPTVHREKQRTAIDERSPPSGLEEEEINKDSSHGIGTAVLSIAGYGFNTSSYTSQSQRKDARDRKVRSGVKALEETFQDFDEERSVIRHLPNETGQLSLRTDQCDGESTTAADQTEAKDRYSIREGMRNEEVEKGSNKRGSIGTEGTKGGPLPASEQQPPALKSILKRRPKSPTKDSVVPSDLEAGCLKSRSRQINSSLSKPSEAKDDIYDLPKGGGGDVLSKEETLEDSNYIPRSRKDLWEEESDLLRNTERGKGKERIVTNGSLNKQNVLISTTSDCELDVQRDVISLSEQTSQSFEVNSEPPVPSSSSSSSVAAVTAAELRITEGISVVGSDSSSSKCVGTKLLLSVDDKEGCVNVETKSTRTRADLVEELSSISSCSSDSHEPPMQSLPQNHSQQNAMESYLSHKRGTRSTSPYSRRIGQRPDDGNNNVLAKQEVAQAPVFLQKFHHIEVSLPSTFEVKFECKIDGYPKPEVLWYKDGKRVLEGHDRYKFQSGPNGWFSLIIPKVMESDKGSFMCEARNSAGKARCSGKLILIQGKKT